MLHLEVSHQKNIYCQLTCEQQEQTSVCIQYPLHKTSGKGRGDKATIEEREHKVELDSGPITWIIGIKVGRISSPKTFEKISRAAALHFRKFQELTVSSSCEQKPKYYNWRVYYIFQQKLLAIVFAHILDPKKLINKRKSE